MLKQNKSAYFGTPSDELPFTLISDCDYEHFENFILDKSDPVPLLFKRAPFRLPFEVGSTSSLELLSAIIECKNKDIYRTELIQFFIEHKWDQIKFWTYLYTSLLWSNIIVLSYVISSRSHMFIYLSFLINAILIGWEAIQLSTMGRQYFQNIMNIIDFIRCFTTILFGIFLLNDFEHSIITWIMIVLNIIRGITGFRAFGNTRYYTKLLQMCFDRMKYFLLIFIYSTLALGIMNSIASNQENITFKSLWSSSFDIIAGTTDSFYQENTIQTITYILAITVNMIIMLNMIISILGDVFDEFQLDAEIYNYSEMADIIFEIEQLLSFTNNRNKLSYLHVCMHAYEKPTDNWKGKIIDIREYLKDKFLNESLKPLLDENNNQIKKIEENAALNFKSMNNIVNTIDEKVVAIDEKVKMMNEKNESNFKMMDEKNESNFKKMDERVTTNFKMMDDKMNTFQNKVGEIEGTINNINENIQLLLSALSKKSD
ncbi:hypothetical protein SteCoe_39165 [Stentor coeruleus]|uniref:Ion transport domain-containing protein n=1 Tax=Stentor coeruleus TaxID=5963 RepID=A0A1R2AKS4_9CILI|nr:hypothetical protein SteCoe_39165 [Stentor coeruleus]